MKVQYCIQCTSTRKQNTRVHRQILVRRGPWGSRWLLQYLHVCKIRTHSLITPIPSWLMIRYYFTKVPVRTCPSPQCSSYTTWVLYSELEYCRWFCQGCLRNIAARLPIRQNTSRSLELISLKPARLFIVSIAISRFHSTIQPHDRQSSTDSKQYVTANTPKQGTPLRKAKVHTHQSEARGQQKEEPKACTVFGAAQPNYRKRTRDQYLGMLVPSWWIQDVSIRSSPDSQCSCERRIRPFVTRPFRTLPSRAGEAPTSRRSPGNIQTTKPTVQTLHYRWTLSTT